MTQNDIDKTVFAVLSDFCGTYSISANITTQTPLIGGDKIMDSMGLVNFIVDIETAFLDEGIDISLTSEAAMSSRISPFRTVGALCNFIAKQLGIENNE